MSTEDETQQAAGAQTGTGSDPDKTGDAQGATKFSQADVDRIVKERLERERGKYADYDTLKTAAAKWQETQDAQKTELQKAMEKAAGLQEQNARLSQERTELLIRSAVVAEASKLGFVDPSDAYRLIDLAKVKVSDAGAVEGVAQELDGIAKGKPYLLGRSNVGATNPARGGAQGETDADRRERLFGRGASILGNANRGGGVYRPTLKEQ
jgi:hypothetical protein